MQSSVPDKWLIFRLSWHLRLYPWFFHFPTSYYIYILQARAKNRLANDNWRYHELIGRLTNHAARNVEKPSICIKWIGIPRWSDCESKLAVANTSKWMRGMKWGHYDGTLTDGSWHNMGFHVCREPCLDKDVHLRMDFKMRKDILVSSNLTHSKILWHGLIDI